MRDAIVIGAGGGGPVVAKELAARGLDVLLLEAGAAFPHADQEWSHLEIAAYNPANGIFRFGPADRTKSPWRRETPQNCAIFQVAGVGGTTLHYVANSPRAMPGVFSDYDGAEGDAYDTAHRFPLGYRELIPYYEWVEFTLPVQTSPMGTKEEIFLDAAASTGLPVQTSKDITRDAFRPQENAILQPEGTAGKTSDPKKLLFPQAKGCTFCGHCTTGCFMPRAAPRNLKAKRSTYVSYSPMALTADLWQRGGKAVTLIPDAFAVNIGTESTPAGSVARRVTWRRGSDGAFFTEEAKVVVMAAGTIESPRLWLNSGLPNPNDQVGRGLTEHAFDWIVGVFPFDTKSTHGPGSAARADFPGRGSLIQVGLQPAFQAFTFGLSDSGMAGFYGNGSPVGAAGADSVGRLVGTGLKSAMSDIERGMNILVMTDDDVEAQNRVMLSDTAPPDEHGAIPRVIVRQRNRSARTVANRDFLAGKAVEILRAAGATQVLRMNFPSVLLHIHSAMRMGSNPDSVLDANAEARTVKRLFIADNSALANSIGGPNPTLTTQALATRTAEKIFQLYFGGQPWVASESPVSSIDPAVTHAVMQRGL
jgi:choline dehydrogenase-like flavoprotein